MQEQLRQRLDQLKQEFETGEKRLQDLEVQQVHLRETLLRISGAIQVIEELLSNQQNTRDQSEPPVGGTRGTA